MTVDRFNPMRASVRSRSALAAALVMTVCLAIVGAGLVLVLFRSLQSSAQGAAAARAEQISAQLRTDTPRELDPSLLVTDSQVGAVQVVDESGTVLAASNGDGQTRNVGRVEDPCGQFDYWVSARAAAVPGGIVTILVGADREPVESVVTKVAALLAVGSPLIIVWWSWAPIGWWERRWGRWKPFVLRWRRFRAPTLSSVCRCRTPATRSPTLPRR
jgi:hypothetical protein